MQKIIAFSGFRKSGKTLISNLLVEISTSLGMTFRKVSFADPVRDMFSKETGIGLTNLTDNLYKEQFRDRLIEFAENLRAKDEYIFINKLFESVGEDESIVIDDLRLFRELEFLLKKKTVIYRVTAENHIRRARGWEYNPDIDEHITEKDLDLSQYTYLCLGGGIITNNGSIEELKQKTLGIIKKHFVKMLVYDA